MAYIWEKYNKDNYYYIPEDRQSYYQEVWRKDGKYVPVNVYNRFFDLFYPICLSDEPELVKKAEERYKKNDKFKDIVNLIIHQLASWDRLKGMTLEDIKMSLVYDSIKEGLYGDRLKDEIDNLAFEDLYIILKELVKSSVEKNREVLLDEVLHWLFGKTILYKENPTGRILIYIEQIRTHYREKLYEIVIYLFADMELKIENFWANEHFGIIGNESTMRIGSIHMI